MSDVSIRPVDFADPADVDAMVAMIDVYASDPMGVGAPLDAQVRAALPARLAEHPAALGWVARVADKPVGVAAAFSALSTFAARPRINIHDLSVVSGHRGLGIGWKLLAAVEEYARATNCCALTLEVRCDNHPAKHLYRKFGFIGPTEWHPPEMLAFWKKTLE